MKPRNTHLEFVQTSGIVLVEASLVLAAWAIGAGLSAIRAAAAQVGGFSLLAVLVSVADEYPAFKTTAGAL
jgi:hypothetical protein